MLEDFTGLGLSSEILLECFLTASAFCFSNIRPAIEGIC